jgi:hypothetical protein
LPARRRPRRLRDWLVKGSSRASGSSSIFPARLFRARQRRRRPEGGFVAADAVVGQGTPPAIANMISADEFTLMQSLATAR